MVKWGEGISGRATTLRARWAWVYRHVTSTPAVIFAFFACLYTLTSQGRRNSYDGMAMFATAQAIVDRGSLAVNNAYGSYGRGGLVYSKYGIGQSLAEIPLYVLGKVIGVLSRARSAQIAEAVTMLTNPLLMALCCALSYGVVRALGYSRSVAIRAALVLGVATSFWPYSKSDFSEPLLTVSVVAAALAALVAAQSNTPTKRMLWLDALGGSAIGVAILTKYVAVALVPVFALYLTLTLSRPRSIRVWILRQAAFGGPVLAAGCLTLLLNYVRFATFFHTGYAAGDQPFAAPLAPGLYGLLLSPSRGLLYYDPVLFAGLLCLPLLAVWRPREALLPVGVLVTLLTIYGTYPGWTGGADWGPRYLLPIMPFLVWPLLVLGCFGPYGATQRGRWPARLSGSLLRTGMGILAALSIAVQLLGISMNYLVYDVYWQGSIPPLSVNLAESPIATAIWTLPLNLRFALTRMLPAAGFASSNYPVGPPNPVNPHMPADLGQFYVQYFWFTLLPHPAVVLGAGLLVLGTGVLLTGRTLLARTAESAGSAGLRSRRLQKFWWAHRRRAGVRGA